MTNMELIIKRDDGCPAFTIMGDPGLLEVVMRDVGVHDSCHEGAITFSWTVGVGQKPFEARKQRIEQICLAASQRGVLIIHKGTNC